MQWLSFFIFAYLAMGFQTGLARAIEIGGTSPNFVLLCVIFISLNAPRNIALLGSLILGVMQDMASQSPMGVYAFSYGLVGLFVVTAQQAMHREHLLTHSALTLVGGIMTAIVVSVHSWWRPSTGQPVGFSSDGTDVHLPFVPLFYTALYSAILAPFILMILQRIRRWFRFQGNRIRLPSRSAQRRSR